MKSLLLTAAALATTLLAAEAASAQSWTPVPVAADERSGKTRQIRCSVGERPKTTCAFTPLFGDGSFQLDGPEIAVRMIIIDGEGSLFEVFGPTHRVPVGGIYVRNPRDHACWISTAGGPSPVCAR